MIIRDVNLETVCGVTSKLPDNTLPEFAFAGKSNVGKSSLINALMNHQSLCKNFLPAWKNPDHQFLQYQQRVVLCRSSWLRLCQGFCRG